MYQRMYKVMKDNDAEVLTDSNDEGKEKVLKGEYAYFMESSTIEYLSERECDLDQVNGLLDQKGYGIAMRKSTINYNFVFFSIPVYLFLSLCPNRSIPILFNPSLPLSPLFTYNFFYLCLQIFIFNSCLSLVFPPRSFSIPLPTSDFTHLFVKIVLFYYRKR